MYLRPVPSRSELTELLTHPKEHRDRTHRFTSTNRVYPVRIHNKKFVIKEYTPFSNVAYLYYKLRRYFPDYYPADVRIQHEVEKLQKLHGSDVTPKYYGKTDKRILLEHLPGHSARDTIRSNPEHILPLAFNRLGIIHQYGLIHGSPVIKNFVYAGQNEGYWVDFEAPTPAFSDTSRVDDLDILIRSALRFTPEALPIALDTLDEYVIIPGDQSVINAVRKQFAS